MQQTTIEANVTQVRVAKPRAFSLIVVRRQAPRSPGSIKNRELGVMDLLKRLAVVVVALGSVFVAQSGVASPIAFSGKVIFDAGIYPESFDQDRSIETATLSGDQDR